MKLRFFRHLLALCLAVSCSQALSRELKIIFAQYTPPYMLDNGGGIVTDIVKAALEPGGYTVVPMPVAMGRGIELYASNRIDGIAPIRESSGLQSNYSDVFIQYHNYAFALKSRNLNIKTLNDLKVNTVIGFQNSSKYLGQAYAAAVAANPGYKEMANQETQTLMLLLGRIDVAIMDESIFRYYREKLIAEGKAPRSAEVQRFDLFPATEYKCAFADAKIRDEFNRGLATIRANGRYDAIYRKYTEQYFSIKK
ncbi:MAG TPA: ABC transporter substrate-binding protein [Rhodocyclaceae bacterium]|nr:ABC transporter substrate-binding protein [Rhodocyclaceae bacterium]